MKNFTLLLLLFIVLSINLLTAQDITAFRHQIILSNKTEKLDNLNFGINSKATYKIDSELGEWEIPNYPPQGAFFGSFQYLDSATGQMLNILSYNDFKSVPAQEKFSIKFLLVVQRSADNELTIEWKSFPKEVDSVKLNDIDFGTIINVDMLKVNKYMVSNQFQNRFYITVWYNLFPTEVAEQSEATNHPIIYPNPAHNIIKIQSESVQQLQIISDLSEIVYQKNEIRSWESIELSDIPSGIYLALLKMRNGGVVCSKLIVVK
ncbi:MAG: Cadherin domain protein [Ignavibacteria bacterium]|nr:Cadherin domain protein [Ignavibacteria bacterium]